MAAVRKVLVMGAAGKDFHVFNTCYRGKKNIQVVCFTATQIPGIEGRVYPSELSGPDYPEGIPIFEEKELVSLIKKHGIQEVIFSYSDVSYAYVEEKAKLVREAGAEFRTADARASMIKSSKPIVAVCAVRTGCGKSQTTRRVIKLLQARGKRVVAVRHPMPYGDLVAQAVQRFASIEDLEKNHCTIEEMEEYEPHLRNGIVVYAGVDYEKILRAAEKEADVVVWDGGNNDTPFFAPDLHITVLDPLRPGHEVLYYPGRENLEMAHVLLINKLDSATPAGVKVVMDNARKYNPLAPIIRANSLLQVENPARLRGKKVLVVEDGPTLTHGDMKIGAGVIACQRAGVKEFVDPRPYVTGEIAATYKKYPDIGILLPAMGYGTRQRKDLERTIAKVPCDFVVIGTPIDLSRVVRIDQPTIRVGYELEEIGSPNLEELLRKI